MKDRKPVGHIFNLHIVRYDVSLDSGRKLLPQFRVGINHEGICFPGNENIRVYFPFRAQDGSLNCELWGRLPDVVGDLAIQKTQSVGSCHAQLHARRKIEKRAALWIDELRHEGRPGRLNRPSGAAKGRPTFREALRFALLCRTAQLERMPGRPARPRSSRNASLPSAPLPLWFRPPGLDATGGASSLVSAPAGLDATGGAPTSVVAGGLDSTTAGTAAGAAQRSCP